ncbi:MAG: AP2 domain-containing protein [Pseudobdellovibrionaceae bacterium]
MSKSWKTIPVNKGKDQAKIDAEDFDEVSKHSWRTVTSKSGRKTVVTTMSTAKGPRMLTLGAFLMKPQKGEMVYPRRFQNGFDYRKENLIVCTMKERQRILPKSRTQGTSLYKGVSFYAKNKCWRAGIRVDGKSIHIGFFASEEEAARAYNEAAKKYFGENAYQNQVQKKLPRRQGDAA